MSRSADVVVIGAGVAGLAATRALLDAGLDVATVEGRDRIGGRVLTIHDPRAPLPLELGAEFIHGQAPHTRALVHERGLSVVIADDERVELQRGRLRPVGDLDAQLGAVFAHVTAADLDGSLTQFLARRPGGKRLAAARRFARAFVMGFHAADPDTVSLRSVVDGSPTDDDDALQSRILSGQGSVVTALADGLHDRISLAHTVQHIRWRKHHVDVVGLHGGRAFTIAAKRCVITVPIAVLQAGLSSSSSSSPPGTAQIAITPVPPSLRAAVASFAMGHVVRITFVFRRRFWVEHAPRLESVAFWQSPPPRDAAQARAFSTWWTTAPVSSPQLVAWVGGPAAQALAVADREAVVARALADLAHVLAVPLQVVRDQLVLAAHHDWSNDPFAGGAYSTIRVGGDDAAATLSRPVSSTLYIAGEATAVDGSSGTVEGAIASGRRAAKQLLRAW